MRTARARSAPVGLPNRDTEEFTCRLYEGVEYTAYWDEEARRRTDALERAIVGGLLPSGGQRLLDVGCGFGRLSQAYADRFRQTVMLDGSMSMLRQARDNTSGRHIYIAADVMRMPLRAGVADAALFVRVFHHLEDSGGCLVELRRVLSEGGRLVLSYANKRSAVRLAKWAARSASHPYHPRHPQPMPVGHGSTFYYHHPSFVASALEGARFRPLPGNDAGLPDAVPGFLGPLGRPTGAGLALAGILGRAHASFWVYTGADARGGTPMPRCESTTDLLQCPSCGHEVVAETDGYACRPCGRFYPIVDGIADFRLPEGPAGDGGAEPS